MGSLGSQIQPLPHPIDTKAPVSAHSYTLDLIEQLADQRKIENQERDHSCSIRDCFPSKHRVASHDSSSTVLGHETLRASEGEQSALDFAFSAVLIEREDTIC